ncbi:MAG: hemolysin family protein [Alphaproteobacteria bacterium]
MTRNGASEPQANGNGGRPANSIIQTLREWLRGLGSQRNVGDSLRNTLEELIEHHGDDEVPVSPDERTMFTNLFKFGELRIDDVMVPRTDVVAVEQSTPVSEVASIMRKAGHSRLPVFRDTLDDIIGMVHVRDLLRFWGSDRTATLTAVVRRLLFVPPSMQVRDLLLQMRASRIHMAIVVDEYGGTDGCVTIEDLIEEIVGDIHDEHDIEERPLLHDRAGGVIEADARATVEDLEQRIGFSLVPDDGDEDIETLGGLVFSLAGRVPARGELVTHPSGLRFEVVEADPRRIKRLRIKQVTPTPTAE